MKAIRIKVKDNSIWINQCSGIKYVYSINFNGYPEPTIANVTVLRDDNNGYATLPNGDYEIIEDVKPHITNDCANVIRLSLCADLVREAKARPNQIPKDVPEMLSILNAIEHIENHITEDWYKKDTL